MKCKSIENQATLAGYSCVKSNDFTSTKQLNNNSMKRILKMSWMVIIVMLFSTLRNSASAQGGVTVSYQTFYDELSPYGQWIESPEYGYVWTPDMDDFRPY